MIRPPSAFAYRLAAPRAPITVEDYRRTARRALPSMVWAFVDGGAEDELTLRANTSAFDDWILRPRVLTGNVGADLRASLGSATLELPVYLSPTGMTGLTHWRGEVAAARAAERAGTRAVVSCAASYTVEEIADATEERHGFQLYPFTSRRTGEPMAQMFLDRARRAGYDALFVTVDVPVPGNRERERKHGMGAPPTLTAARMLEAATKPRWSANLLRHQRMAARMLVDERGADAAVRSAAAQQGLMQPDMTWEDLARVRDLWPGPMYVKGILEPDDAEAAVRLGADGVVVSNHGGRQLDGVAASLDALPAIVDRLGPSTPVYLDGGIRRGSDVVKALALGATAVGIGRPYLYGLATDGEAGVGGVLEIFRQEISRTLTLLGCASVAELDRSHLHAADGARPAPRTTKETA